MPLNVLCEPLNTCWKNNTIKEKFLRADFQLKNPEFYALVESQLAGTWRPKGMKPPSVANHDAESLRFPVSGYGGHQPSWRFDVRGTTYEASGLPKRPSRSPGQSMDICRATNPATPSSGSAGASLPASAPKSPHVVEESHETDWETPPERFRRCASSPALSGELTSPGDHSLRPQARGLKKAALLRRLQLETAGKQAVNMDKPKAAWR
eukprot:TRINITY_DN51764_c0_g1_i1.p1 TRINITY_DN51764_c0_g1~~TRINITY_DN51764_c0_g1_i1.p1  ORF type:complete len:209 (+),score=26.87 TRINITY_DN51764_c0_g1_i1:96-722(+)